MRTFLGGLEESAFKKKKKKRRKKDFVGLRMGVNGHHSFGDNCLLCCSAVQTTGRTSYSLVQQIYHPRFSIKK